MNEILLKHIIVCKAEGKISQGLWDILLEIVDRYFKRSQYVLLSDGIKNYAIYNLNKSLLKFNPDKSKNPYAFIISLIHNSICIQVTKQRKLDRILKINYADEIEYNWFMENQRYFSYQVVLTKPKEWVLANMKGTWFIYCLTHDRLYLEDKNDYILAKLAN